MSISRFLSQGDTSSQLVTLLCRYDHISYLILNAGTATYSHFDYLLYSYDIMRYPTLTVTHPRANIQKIGALSEDNLGYTWQCNVFGHYCVVRLILNSHPCSITDLRRRNTSTNRSSTFPLPVESSLGGPLG